MDIGSLWVVEWSHSQKCFHVQTLAEALRYNCRSMTNGQPVDFIILGVLASREQADKEIAQIREKYLPDV